MGSNLGRHKFSVEDDSKSDDSTTDENRRVREYEEYCKELIFIEDKDITVKKKQKFAKKFSNNYTIPPEFWSEGPKLKSTEKEIKLIEKESFYPYPSGYCGGDTVTIYVFQAMKKGEYKINFSSSTINVTVI